MLPADAAGKSGPGSAAIARRLCAGIVAAALAGCASYSTDEYADYFDLNRSEIEGDGFRHVVFARERPRPDDELHIYIDADGDTGSISAPASDPTPELSMALTLAAKDGNDVAVVGRPCYFGVADGGRCEPKFWTSHRYSQSVVDSMAAAIARLRQPRHEEILLIGYGGGGVIAVLLAERIDGVVAVITVGSNLDVATWASANRLEALHSSIDPATAAPVSGIPHFVLIGDKHDSVKANMLAGYIDGRDNVDVWKYPGYDDYCCWEKDWEGILEDVDDLLDDAEEPPRPPWEDDD